MNRTQGGDTVMFWPDTVLSIDYFGLNDHPIEENVFQVFQNYPNPSDGQTTVSLYIPEKDKVTLMITDNLGRKITQYERVLNKGKHSFLFVPGNGNLYYLTAIWQGYSSSIKMICVPSYSPGGKASLDYLSGELSVTELKSFKAIKEFVFNPGDELLYIGYTDTLQSGMLDFPEGSTAYTFQFATNIPCPGTRTVDYEGQTYNTIQIFSQCWLKENLNVGTMISGDQEMTDNNIIEKYCKENEPDSCDKYGGLYQWNEMMQYTTQQGAQGICPPGWHLPTDEEWKVLEGSVDSQYGIGSYEWDRHKSRGFDAGKNLKAIHGWGNGEINFDLFGFSALPGGFNYTTGGTMFDLYWVVGYWWVSEEWGGRAWDRRLMSGSPLIGRPYSDADWFLYHFKSSGLSVRCLKN
jgi:uncharacterized protein (TIGR02145 family)